MDIIDSVKNLDDLGISLYRFDQQKMYLNDINKLNLIYPSNIGDFSNLIVYACVRFPITITPILEWFVRKPLTHHNELAFISLFLSNEIPIVVNGDTHYFKDQPKLLQRRIEETTINVIWKEYTEHGKLLDVYLYGL